MSAHKLWSLAFLLTASGCGSSSGAPDPDTNHPVTLMLDGMKIEVTDPRLVKEHGATVVRGSTSATMRLDVAPGISKSTPISFPTNLKCSPRTGILLSDPKDASEDLSSPLEGGAGCQFHVVVNEETHQEGSFEGSLVSSEGEGHQVSLKWDVHQ